VEGLPPKVLITTTRRASPGTFTFADELTDLFPLSEFHRRDGHHIFKDVVKAAVDRDFTHLVVVNESRKSVDSLSVVKLPEGPTAVFKLTSVKLNKQIHNHGRSSSHHPELILNNFTTRLGHTVGRLFVSLFPHNPEFKGRQAVTFHNQRDFIFVRRHRYIFDDVGKKARLQEIGPQFTLKLHGLYNAACDLKDAPVEWSWKPHAVDNKMFAL
jgi:ribosome production factor 1